MEVLLEAKEVNWEALGSRNELNRCKGRGAAGQRQQRCLAYIERTAGNTWLC